MPNVLSPRDLVFRRDNMDETVPHTSILKIQIREDAAKVVAVVLGFNVSLTAKIIRRRDLDL